MAMEAVSGERFARLLPPGPGSPAAVQGLRWLLRPYDLLAECARRYGDAFTLRLGGFGRVVVVSDPAAIRSVFTAPAGHLEPGSSSEIFRPFIGDHSLLLLEGEGHLRERRLVQPALHGGHVRALTPLVVDAVRDAIERREPGRPFAMHELTREVSLRVMLQGVVGLRGRARIERAMGLSRALLGSTLTSVAFIRPLRVDLGAWSPWGCFQRLAKELDAILFAEIAERRGEGDDAPDDPLGALLRGRDAEGAGLTDAELRDELLTLLFAGHDTTSTSLAWALHRAHGDAHVAERLVAEVDALGDPSRAGDVARCAYLDAVCREALRVHPVVPLVVRGVRAPFEVAGRRLEPGVFVAPCVYLAHRRAETFSAPEEFRPERFLAREYSPYEYLPFGGGVRRCVGMALALHVMRVAVAAAILRARLRPEAPGVERTVRRAGTLVPERGCRMVVTELRA